MAPNLSSSRLSDFVLGKLSPEESLRVLDDLENDPEASETVDYYASLLAYAQGEGKVIFEGRAGGGADSPGSRIGRAIRVVSKRPWILAAAAVLVVAVAVGSLMGKKSILWGADAKYAALSNVDFHVGMRTEADDELMAAWELFRDSEYDRSVAILERMLRVSPTHPFPDQVNYSLGIVHLVAAAEGGVGSVRVFDRAHVRRGLESLRRAARLTASTRLAQEAYWLMAKGHLMVGDRESALAALEEVRERGGKREVEARRLKILIESEL